jgi:bromodomain-containing factor 1
MSPEEEPRKKAVASAGPTKPKKNKPMGKHEQEAQISSIQAKLAKFDNNGADEPGRSEGRLSGGVPMRSIEQGDSSSDDDGSDESEEE